MSRVATWVGLLLLAAIGCGEGSRANGPGAVPTWRLSAQPRVDIGVVEGEEPYQLYSAIGSTLLGDGRIVVANAGSGQLRFFEPTGRFITQVGGRGGGPGEFRNLIRVHRWGRDSVIAYVAAGYRMSIFDDAGRFGRTMRVDSAGLDPEFPLDVWLYRHYWVEGTLRPADRARARRTIDHMPVPPDSVGFHYASVALDGDIWVREPLVSDAMTYRWTVFDTTGTPAASIETPERFDVHEIGRDYVLGRWRNADDVNFIRLYALERSDSSVTLPRWLSAPAPAPKRPLTPEQRNQLIAGLKSDLRNLVVAEERFYADSITYTADVSHLTFAVPEGVRLDIVAATGRGWVGVATHRDLDVICGMGVGDPTPAGWNEGEPKCG